MQTEHLAIKDWSEDDQPREKLMSKGRYALSDAELMAILIGSGTRNQSAVELSKKVLKEAAGNNLDTLSKLSINDLVKFKGIGYAKAITIVAAMELSRRRKENVQLERPVVLSSRHAFDLLKPFLTDLQHEEFFIVLLNSASKVIKIERLAIGGVNSTVADIRLMFKHAIENLATGLVLAHNHPSDVLIPSEMDIQLTRRVKEAGNLMSIQLFDHIIVGSKGYYSFADEGTI